MDQGNLFDWLEDIEKGHKQEPTSTMLKKSDYEVQYLSERLCQIIWQHIQKGVTSALTISELIAKEKDISKDRQGTYISNKPLIYPYVCMFLDQKVQTGELQLIKKELEDRNYQLCNEINNTNG